MPSILTATHLTKRFGDHVAVDDISFALGKGEILGLLGVNGAGKTTTIQMLLGILTPSAGEISYFGKAFATHREEILEKVNFSSTYVSLPQNLTVMECLRFVTMLYTIGNARKRLSRIIELFRLEKLLTHKILDLSAGQMTRVNLSKALINSPKILLLDEPTASLDPEVAAYIRTFLLEERDSSGTSIILTSHNMAEVEEVCDRAVFIHNGKIVADDTPRNLAHTLRTAKVELYAPDDATLLAAYCTEHGLAHAEKRGRVTIAVAEEGIAGLLQDLGARKIRFEEISIEKPTLEDYFLRVAKITDTTYHED